MALDSALLRMASLPLGEIPSHPLFGSTESEGPPRPDPISFLITLLNAGNDFIGTKNFSLHFKSHSHRPAPPSNTDVESLTYSIPAEELEKVDWKKTGIDGFSRSTPRALQPEHWCARRSYHDNISSKTNPSTASWDEFVYGLRDEHSKHEFDFTPTLYDARHILDWNDVIAADFSSATGRLKDTPYTSLTMSIYEMCHSIPFPLSPRCFPVLVATASTSPQRFIAVTIPVKLENFAGAFYSNGKHKTEGADRQQRKDVVLGEYAAVEQVELLSRSADGSTTGAESGKKEVIEWIMATASDAKGTLPLAVQKATIPSQVVKDVGFFLKWIHTVKSDEVQNQQPATHSAR